MNALSAEDKGGVGVGGLVLRIALCTIIGIPLVAFVWESLNELLAGHWHSRHLLLTLPALALLLLFWRLMGRAIERWDAR